MPPNRRRRFQRHNHNRYPRSPVTGRNRMRDIAPRSGMTYQWENRILHQRRRDAQVANALKNTGYDLSAAGLRRAFIPMFQLATPIFIDGRAEGKDLWDMLSVVQQQLDWARRLGGSVFFELFTCLYTLLVVQLVQFRKAVGDCPQEDSLSGPNYESWILADAEVYNVLAGGIYEDNEDIERMQHNECDDLIPQMTRMTIEKSEEALAEPEHDQRDDLIPPTTKTTINKPEESVIAMELDN
ncbi:hypothetical protein F4803DRAFT_569628 [Xylaria telfairii]|nr:hypothetical protein F4803DRAFT_569628 [Xylaria telfairii]